MDIGIAVVVATFIIVAGVLTGFIVFINRAGGVIETGGKATGVIAKEASSAVKRVVTPIVDAIADRIRTKSEDLNRLRTECINLNNEIERLKSQKVDVLSVRSILMLALAEMKCSLTDFKKTILTDTPASNLKRHEIVEYLGLAQVDYKIRLGVDLEKLRFRFADISSKKIHVSGLRKIEIIGVKEIEPKWMLTEVRRHLTEGTVRGEIHEIIQYDKTDEVQKQNIELLGRLESNQIIPQMENAMERITVEVLNAFCKKSGYEFIPEDKEIKEGLDIKELFNTINSNVEINIGEKQNSIRQIESQIKETVALAKITDTDKNNILAVLQN